jgi:hypothetical protein
MNKHTFTIDSKVPRWTVEFTELRAQNEHQKQVRDSIDRRTLLTIIDIYLAVAVPGARVIERQGMQAWTISFPSRDMGRRFVASFGGKWKAISAL